MKLTLKERERAAYIGNHCMEAQMLGALIDAQAKAELQEAELDEARSGLDEARSELGTVRDAIKSVEETLDGL